MRKPLIAGNWKMNLGTDEAVQLARDVARHAAGVEAVDVLLCPSFTLLDKVHGAIADSTVTLGAQNLHNEPKGAFTGEISATMLVDARCTHVIVGHSERRQYFGETDASVRRKTLAALDAGLIPIICVGETLEEREEGSTATVVERQVKGALERFTPPQIAKVVIAYEPVWAIGTGRTATPEMAQEVHAMIRQLVAQLFDDDTAQAMRILYGGSMKPENAADLLGQPDIDGGLIGGASLKAEAFNAIIDAAK